jgi:outer membrane protein
MEVDLEMSRTAHAVLMTLALAWPAYAQEAAPSPAPEPQPAPAAPTQASPYAAPAIPTVAPTGPVLPLSLADAVQRAGENNVDIAVGRFDPLDSAEQIDQLRGFYEPTLTSNLSTTSRDSATTSALAGADTLETDTMVWNFGAFKQLRTGGLLQFSFQNNKFETNNTFEDVNPSYGSNFNLNFQQPLLRNFKTDATRTQIKIARKNLEISDLSLKTTIVNTETNVKQLYNNLIYALDNLEAQRKSLALANRLLEENRIRVRVGTMAPLDVVSAESEYASREEAVIVAEAGVQEAQDDLKRAIFPENDPAMWATVIQPTERPSAEAVTIDTEGAVTRALAARTDIETSRRNLESTTYNLEYAKNQRLPQLTGVVTYGTSGVGGTLIQRTDPTSGQIIGEVINTVPGGWADALSDAFGNDFPTWSVGVNFSYPILNKQAGAAVARAKISQDQAQASLRRLELNVASEVRSAGRAVETNWKRVESTRAARVLAERRLDAETKRFAAGMSTNFLVTQAQRDLSLAEVAELRAVADYRNSLVNFDRVQVAGVGGAGTSLSLSTRASTAGGGDLQAPGQ